MKRLPCGPARHRGFTITELLIAVAIVAILVAIALPAFLEAIARSRRADAQVALNGLTLALERYYTSRIPPTYAGASTTGTGAIFASEAPLDGAQKLYTLSIELPAAEGTAPVNSYTVVAARIAGRAQANDRCGDLTLTNTGVRGIRNAAANVTWPDCWR